MAQEVSPNKYLYQEIKKAVLSSFDDKFSTMMHNLNFFITGISAYLLASTLTMFFLCLATLALVMSNQDLTAGTGTERISDCLTSTETFNIQPYNLNFYKFSLVCFIVTLKLFK
jgi:ABC-type proline/glycine betaine transport system permease subunit